MNSTNPADDYHSGAEFRADFAAVLDIRHRYLAGIVGYALQQTTADEGSGTVLGSFRAG